jgi:glyoxalase family protein
MRRVNGLHHITAISGPAQENVDFYAGILGMHLVKRSVNQDDPGTYHLFYADAEGSPGSDLTFFPWPDTTSAPRLGYGLAVETSLEVPAGSLDYWNTRLTHYGVSTGDIELRFGDRHLPITDQHGFRLTLAESTAPSGRLFTPWSGSPVPQERQVRGLFGARLWEQNAERSSLFLTKILGLARIASAGEWTRYGCPGAAGVVDVRQTPEKIRGAWGVGTVHHLAWRVNDDQDQLAMRDQIEMSGSRITPVIDRFWFKSVYFREPGGVLFEIATDGPGFATDEDPAHLGESLVLPPWLERQRDRIQAALSPLTLPSASYAAGVPESTRE